MITVDGVLNSLATIVPTSGLTGGAIFAVFLAMIRSEKLWFDRQHQAVITEKDKQIAQEKASHDREMASTLAELERTREDRDAYKEAGERDRQRADSVQGRVLDTVVPVLSGVDHALNELARQAEARGEGS